MLTSSAAQLMLRVRHAAAVVPRQLQASVPKRTCVSEAYSAEAAAGSAGQAAVFTAFAVYKGKGAVSVKPVRARWTQMESGGWKLDKEGGFMFELAAAVGERRYDWDNKVAIFLSPLELAAIVTAPDSEHTLYHDTFKGQPGREGMKTKTLKWSANEAASAFFINASMVDKTDGSDKKLQASVSLTPAELFVLKSLVQGSMPSMYGFDAAFQSGGV